MTARSRIEAEKTARDAEALAAYQAHLLAQETARLSNLSDDLAAIGFTGISQKILNNHPQIPPAAKSILWKHSENLYYALVKKKTTGGVLLGFSNNKTMTSDSLATATNQETRFRLVSVLNFVYACVYKHIYSASMGSVSQLVVTSGTVLANEIPTNTTGSGSRNGVSSALTYNLVNQNGDFLEYQCKSQNGKITLALYCGATSTATATVRVNGTDYPITPVANNSNTIKLYEFNCRPLSDVDTHTVRVTHTGANGDGLRVIGVNYYELDNWSGADYDSFAYYRDSAYADYLTTGSANDSVIKQWNASGTNQIYGLSYHGGETGIVGGFFDGIDEVVIAGDNKFRVVKNLNLKSSCKVTWANGEYVDIVGKWEVHEGAISFQCAMRGNVITRELYTHMFGLNLSFSNVVYPVFVDLAQVADQERVEVSRTSKVIVENPTTKQRFVSEMTLHQEEQNTYEGAWFWHVNGSYNKLYYAKCAGGKLLLDNIAFTSVHSFE